MARRWLWRLSQHLPLRWSVPVLLGPSVRSSAGCAAPALSGGLALSLGLCSLRCPAIRPPSHQRGASVISHILVSWGSTLVICVPLASAPSFPLPVHPQSSRSRAFLTNKSAEQIPSDSSLPFSARPCRSTKYVYRPHQYCPITHTRVRAHTHRRTHTHRQTHTHRRRQTHTHAHTHRDAHTETHAHTQTHMHCLKPLLPFLWRTRVFSSFNIYSLKTG